MELIHSAFALLAILFGAFLMIVVITEYLTHGGIMLMPRANPEKAGPGFVIGVVIFAGWLLYSGFQLI